MSNRSYSNSLAMYVVNNLNEKATFNFSHRYSDETAQILKSPAAIGPKECAGPLMVGFRTGFGETSSDHWYCEARTASGRILASKNGTLDTPTDQLMLTIPDDGMIYYCSFSEKGFIIPRISSLTFSGGPYVFTVSVKKSA